MSKNSFINLVAHRFSRGNNPYAFFLTSFIAGIFLSCLVSTSIAQSLDKNYTPIKSVGTLPSDFTQKTRKKISEDLEQLEEKDTQKKNLEQSFVVESNFAIDQKIRSGDILVNDEVGIYVNKVADQLFENNPELRSKLKIYVTKSPVTNAFCYDKGYLFINMGLIAQLENEAQLAYVLSHEAIHFIKKHSLNAYIEYDDINKSNYEDTYQEKELQKYSYSQENETEADAKGFELYVQSKYNVKQVQGVFDVLQYSYLPFEEVVFDTTFFTDEYYQFPAGKYFLKETQGIKSNDNYDDKKSTHPNIRKRRAAIDLLLQGTTDTDKNNYLVSENDFIKVRDICRFESCRLYLVERSYCSSFYSAYLLLKKYPDNLFLHQVVTKSLYALSLYKHGKLNYDYDSYNTQGIPYYDDIEGYSQQVNYFFSKIPDQELTILSLRYAWKAHKKFQQDTLLLSLSDSLFSLLISQKFDIKDFSDKSKDEIISTNTITATDTAVRKEEGTISKYDVIRKKQQSVQVKKEEYYYKYAFVKELSGDDEFKKKFNTVSFNSMFSDSEQDALINHNYNSKKAKKKTKKQENQKLDIDKLLIFDPFYVKIDKRKKQDYRVVNSEIRREKYIDILTGCAGKLGIKYEIIDPESFTVSDIDKYNEYSVFKDWLNERFDGDIDNNTLVLNSEEIKQIAKKYNTRYCLWTGIVNVHEKKRGGRILLDVALCLSVYGLPYGIYDLCKKNVHTTYYILVFDLETGLVKLVNTTRMKSNDSKDLLNSFVYSSLYTIKK